MKVVVFPGTVTNKGDELEAEAALKNGSCCRMSPVFELAALYGLDSKRLGLEFTLAVVVWNEMELGPWLVLLT